MRLSGFFIVLAIGKFCDDATCKGHLNKSRVEQSTRRTTGNRGPECESVEKDVPERKRKREVCEKTSVSVLTKHLIPFEDLLRGRFQKEGQTQHQ